MLEAHQLRPRVDTDLVAQHGAGDFDRSQGVDRPTGPVQRQGQLGPTPLAEGLRGHGVGQRRDELSGLSPGQAHVRRQLFQLGRPLLEPGHRRRKRRIIGQPAERPAPPERRRRLHLTGGIEEPAVACEGRGALDEPLEAMDVDVAGIDLGDVAPVPPGQRAMSPSAARRLET